MSQATGGSPGGEPVYNVLDFGADPTGTSDSTPAFQAALDIGDRPVYVPGGLYSVAGLMLPAGAVLRGAQAASYGRGAGLPAEGTLSKLYTQNAAAAASMMTAYDTGPNGPAQNFVIEDLQLSVGNGYNALDFPDTAGGSLLDRFAWINRCYFEGGGGTSGQTIYVGANNGTVKLTECVINGGQGEGIKIVGSSCTLTNCLIGNFASQAAVDLGNGDDNRVIGCDVFSSERGVVMAGYGQQVIGGGINNCNQMGILEYSDHVAIIGVHFHSNSQVANGAHPHIDLANANTVGVVIEGNNFGPLDGGVVNKVNYGFQVAAGCQVLGQSNALAPGTATVGMTNYTGVQVAPAVGASGAAVANPTGVPCQVFVIGGAVTAVAINGVAMGNPPSFPVGSSDTVTLTYSAAPTWEWVAAHN